MFIAKFSNRLNILIRKPYWLIVNSFLLKIQNVKYKQLPIINGIILIKNRGEISIGYNFKVNSFRYCNPVGNCIQTAIFCEKNGKIRIGDNVSISSTLIFSNCEIIIEDRVMIGGGTQIWDTDFHPMNHNDRLKHEISKIKMKPVLLKRGCFIGANSIILKGTVVGENSIIAAGSVVSKSVPDNEIWGGNPAVFIKKVNELYFNN